MIDIELFLLHLDYVIDVFPFNVVKFLWQSSVLIIAVWGICKILENQSPRIKSVIWTIAILIIPFLPLLSSTMVTNNAWDINIEFDTSTLFGSIHTEEFIESEQVTSKTIFSESPFVNLMKYKWAIVFLTYCLGFLTMFVIFTMKIFRVYRWRIKGQKVKDLRIKENLENLKNRIGLSRAVKTFQSNEITVPTVIGIFAPAILLPSSFLERFDEKTIDVVIAHECVHIARRDNLIMLYASFLQTVLFFHPLVWFAINQLAFKIEEAVDNAVMEKTEIKASSYASILFGMAAVKLAPTTILPFSRNHKLLTRISNILKSTNTNQEGLKMSKLKKYSLVFVVGIALIFGLFININYGSKNIISGIDEAQNQELIYMAVSGKVIDPDGNPVAGIPVDAAYEKPRAFFGNSLTGDDRFMVRTDLDGDFLITFPTSIKYVNGNAQFNQMVSRNFAQQFRRNSGNDGGIVLVAHAGNKATFISDHRWMPNLANGISQPIKLRKGDVGPVTIKLTRGATISGMVYDRKDRPLPKQRVRVVYTDGRYSKLYRPFTITDEDGHFTITNVRPGKIWVIATERYMIFDGKSPFPDNSIVTLDVLENTTIDGITMVGLTMDELKATLTPEIMKSFGSKMKYNIW